MDAWARAAGTCSGAAARQLVLTEFEQCYPGQVDFVTPVYNLEAVEGTHDKYTKVKEALTDLLDNYVSEADSGEPVERRMVRHDPSSSLHALCSLALLPSSGRSFP